MNKPPFCLGNAVFGVPNKAVLIGSVFYKSDRKVIDHGKGEVNEEALARELKSVQVLKERVGLDHALDVIAETPAAMERYLELVARMTEDPLLIGGLNEEARTAGYQKAKELGIQGRCGVNSLGPATTEGELTTIRDNGIKFALLQTMDTSAVYPQEKVALIQNTLQAKGSKAGIEMAAIDVGIVDFTSAWLAAESIRLIHRELNMLAGCAPSNAAYQPLVSHRISRKSARSMNIALNTLVQLAGSDFVIYGPLRAASYVFEATAIVEAIKAYGAGLVGEKVIDRGHPLHQFLPKLR